MVSKDIDYIFDQWLRYNLNSKNLKFNYPKLK